MLKTTRKYIMQLLLSHLDARICRIGPVAATLTNWPTGLVGSFRSGTFMVLYWLFGELDVVHEMFVCAAYRALIRVQARIWAAVNR